LAAKIYLPKNNNNTLMDRGQGQLKVMNQRYLYQSKGIL